MHRLFPVRPSPIGKYSWWDEYNEDDRREESDEESEADDDDDINQGRRMPVIKGVLADDKLEQEAIRQQKRIERMEREEIVEQMTLMKPGVSSISASAQAQARALQKQERTEDDGSDDDDFLVRYRQQRIRQLQQACSPPC